ncbi:trans-sulfuration enzyme family protein [Massiliimalia massiliensis]|uniref:trans-sulfuration enzyme family protein n=1 Tax=Massiliimalia massiliensis TaxID=1852384 RepID=UPI0038994C50
MNQMENDSVILEHLGDENEKYMGAVVPPVYLTSLHVFDTAEEYLNFDASKEGAYIYGRVSNPTVEIAERKIAALERGERALLFSSGMAATSSAIMAACKAGSHIICMNNAYGPVKTFITQVCMKKFQMTVSYVKGLDISEYEQAIRPETALIIMESPSTFAFSVTPIRQVTALAKKHGIKTYIDNTYCTPIFQKPLEMGVDLVMHTLSKYMGGHSDIIGGVLVSKDAGLMDYIQSNMRELYGGIMGPMEAWLVLRGLRTLSVRVKAHQDTAMAVAEFLEKQDKVSCVRYTGLKSHPQHDLIAAQQTGHTGLMTFDLDGEKSNALKLVNKLRYFKIGCSWGGFESLAIPVMYKASREELDFLGLSGSTIRIHCGLEDQEVLLEDLDQALRSL